MSGLCEASARPASSQPGATSRTLVLALGSPLRGDDGLGAAVLEELTGRGDLPGDVDLIDGGTPGLETALMLEGYRRAIIIDAADLGRRPGEWERLVVDPNGSVGPETSCGRGPVSLHEAGLAEALVLGAALGKIPESVTVYAVQPLECGISVGLSRPVRAAVAEVCAAIQDEIGSARAG